MKMKLLLNRRHLIVMSLAIAALLIACSTPKLADFATETNIVNKVKYDHPTSTVNKKGRGYTLQLSQMKELPKRIALVSVYGIGPVQTAKGDLHNADGSINMARFGKSNMVPPDELRGYVNQFYNASISSLKEVFKKNNMELLTPDQFLNTDEKKTYYKKFKVEHDAVNKLLMKLLGNRIDPVIEPADGYIAIDIKNGNDLGTTSMRVSEDSKMCQGVGFDLTKELGVDAVIVMNICAQASTGGKDWTRSLTAASCYMLGPNTVIESLGKEDGYASKGVYYCGTRIFPPKKALLNPKPKKMTEEEIKTNNNKGFENIAVALAEKMGQYFKDWKPAK